MSRSNGTGMAVLWDEIDLVQCITLRTRPERRAQVTEQFAAVGLTDRVEFLEQERCHLAPRTRTFALALTHLLRQPSACALDNLFSARAGA